MFGLGRYSDWPINRKVSFIVVMTSGVLILVMVLFVTIEKSISFRAKLRNDSSVLAEIIGANSTAALTFNDDVTAHEILSALKAEKVILEAALYYETGKMFSHYISPKYVERDQAAKFPDNITIESLKREIVVEKGWFITSKPIILDNVIGYVLVRTDLSSLNRQIKYFIFFIVLLSIFLLCTAIIICSRLNQTIHKPMILLAETMKNVALTKNFKISAVKSSNDEIGILIDGFNSMLEGIGKRDDELVKYRDELEEQVGARTIELIDANKQLRREIEERQEVQAKLVHAQKMEAIGTLAGGVAHDLNNILSGIVSYPELLLLDLPEGHKFREPLLTIKDSGEKAAVIVDDLLAMARRGVGKHHQVHMNPLVEKYSRSHECRNMLVHHPGVQLELHLDAHIDALLGSEVHLMKTLMNLTSNGAESIGEAGKITISTSNEYIDTVFRGYDHVREGEYVKLSVADTGAGIPAENIERIFEPFFTTKEMGRSGSGLGMAVVWGTVKDHNGYINITSEVGKGTTFDVYFPLVRDSEQEIHAEEDSSYFPGNGERVLVVDDMFEQRAIATHMLERLGYAVKAVARGEEAVDYLRHQSVDIVLLDMIMPEGMDGLETYRNILEIFPNQKAIIASGYSEDSKVQEVQRLGAGAYLKKPYSIGGLAKAIHEELGKKTDQ